MCKKDSHRAVVLHSCKDRARRKDRDRDRDRARNNSIGSRYLSHTITIFRLI